MTTLVVCVDRTNEIGRKTGTESPVTGTEAIRDLVLDLGLADPEDSGVNALLETLRIANDLEAEGRSALPVAVAGASDSMVGADRSVADQLDAIKAEHDPDSAIVVIDSAQDERLVPIVESRLRVDSVDRVVVRQARDLESTYYLLKQFLADEELRQTILVPLGITLLVFPAISVVAGMAVALATITAVIGVFLLYKGIGVERYLGEIGRWARQSLYSGQVSIVTYVVALGLLAVGMIVGALAASEIPTEEGYLLMTMQFLFDSIPWIVGAGLTASAGRLLDLLIQEERIRLSYLNLPFIVLAVGLVLRGFTGYLLAQGDLLAPLETPELNFAVVTIDSFILSPAERLVMFVLSGILVAVIGVRIATYLNERVPYDSDVAEGRSS